MSFDELRLMGWDCEKLFLDYRATDIEALEVALELALRYSGFIATIAAHERFQKSVKRLLRHVEEVDGLDLGERLQEVLDTALAK